MIGHCDKFRTEILNAQEIKLREIEYVLTCFSKDPLLDDEEKYSFNRIWIALGTVHESLGKIIRKSKEGEI